MTIKKWLLVPTLAFGLLAVAACSRDLVPDNVLEGLHKPVVTGISPTEVRFSGGGFFLSVSLETAEDAQYVLYINERQIGQIDHGDARFWEKGVGWLLTEDTLSELLASSPNSRIFSVRITGIQKNYDISADFERYNDFVSEPQYLEIAKGEAEFSAARQLFPEWTHSYGPILRSDSQGGLYLAWSEKINDVAQAFFSHSIDNGQTWSQVLNISRSSQYVYDIDLAADSQGHFYMVWNYFRYASDGSVDYASGDVFFSRSLDHGATWHLPVRLNAVGEIALSPSLLLDEQGDLFVSYLLGNPERPEFTPRLAVSRDLGNSWFTRIFDVTMQDETWRPQLVRRDGSAVDLLVTWRFGSQKNFRIYTSADRGDTWQAEDSATDDHFVPYVNHYLLRAGAGKRTYLVWGAGSSAGHNFSLWKKFLRRGESGEWDKITDLLDYCPGQDEPTALSVSAASVDLVMNVDGGLFLLRSTDEGRTWPVPETVKGSEGVYGSYDPDMVFHSSGRTFLVFCKPSAANYNESSLYLTSFE